MGAGAFTKSKKYQEPYHVEVSPQDSVGMNDDLKKVVAPSPKVAQRRFSEGDSAEVQRKRKLKEVKAQREMVRQTILLESLASKVSEPGSPVRAKLMISTDEDEVDGALKEFPSLLDADAVATTKIREVHEELTSSAQEDLEKRRQIFRALCLKWHASRNAGTPAVRWADRVYQHLMKQREWYLALNPSTSPTHAHLHAAFTQFASAPIVS